MNTSGETELVNESDSDDDSGDPGVVIIYTNADNLLACCFSEVVDFNPLSII